MGLFSYIKVDQSINLPYPDGLKPGYCLNNLSYQTKSLDRLLSTYILKDNKLFKQEEYVWDEKDYSIATNQEILEQAKETVILDFYASIPEENQDIFLDYRAIYVDGVLIKPVELTRAEFRSNVCKKKQDAELKKKLAFENKLAKTKIKKYLVYSIRAVRFWFRTRAWSFGTFLSKTGQAIIVFAAKKL